MCAAGPPRDQRLLNIMHLSEDNLQRRRCQYVYSWQNRIIVLLRDA